MIPYIQETAGNKAGGSVMDVSFSVLLYGVFLVSIPLLVTVAKGKTCLPKWAWLANTLPLTLVAAIIFAGMGAMNVGSALMFVGLYFLIKES